MTTGAGRRASASSSSVSRRCRRRSCGRCARPTFRCTRPRVTARAPWAQWNADRTSVDLAEDVLRGARQFASMRLSSVVIGHSSSSFAGGAGWDEAVVAQLSGVVGDDIAVTTNGLDCLAALRTVRARRPFLVLPPWFNRQPHRDRAALLCRPRRRTRRSSALRSRAQMARRAAKRSLSRGLGL